MRRNLFPALALVGLLAAGFTGCDDSTPTDASDNTPSVTTEDTEATTEETTESAEATEEPTAESTNVREQELITLAEPAEGATVSGSFTAAGTAAAFEATIDWRILDAEGALALDGFATAEECCVLSPWQVDIDVADLAPGSYLFEAWPSDPSDGEGGEPQVVAATIVVE